MRRLNVTSNAIRTIGYDEDSARMEVEFHNGRRYEIRGVGPGVHDDLINADSIGTHFHRNIRTNPKFKIRELGPLRDSKAKDEEPENG
jgi:hypothetical protein